MCGRYYIDDDTAKETEKLVRQAEAKLHSASAAARSLVSNWLWQHGIECRRYGGGCTAVGIAGGFHRFWLRWGFPMEQGQKKRLVFNARCESAAAKPFFRDGIRHRRIAVPAAAFYEWDKAKTKYTFQRQEQKALYMAGCCRHYSDGEHFIILTTDANSSMQPIHNRMPLLLEETEVRDWILNSDRTDSLLRKIPPLLDCGTDFEQMSFF